ncbi:Maltose O-acetyltransferase [compost metagenome]
MNSVVLPGVTLGARTIVAAGSVVTKSFPSGQMIIGGVPAVLLKRISASSVHES